MEKVNLDKLTVADVIITDMEYFEEENKTELFFKSPFGNGEMILFYNTSIPDEENDDYETVEASLGIDTEFDDEEYKNKVIDKLFELLSEAIEMISKQDEE